MEGIKESHVCLIANLVERKREREHEEIFAPGQTGWYALALSILGRQNIGNSKRSYPSPTESLHYIIRGEPFDGEDEDVDDYGMESSPRLLASGSEDQRTIFDFF